MIFFDFPPPPPPLAQSAPAPESLSRHGRRQAAYQRLVSFIREEKFDEALQFIRRQSNELRSWPGLAALEAGLLSVADPAASLSLYDQILRGKNRDRYWVRALSGYRALLRNLSESGDYLARARLARLLALEWRNQEAKSLLTETLADVALPTAVRADLESFGAVLDLRLGNFAEAEAYWKGKPDLGSRRYLAVLYLRQGRLAEAADIRLGVAKVLKGAARLKELARVFDVLVKGGLTKRAVDLLADEPELKKRLISWSYYLGLSCLVEKNPEAAEAYFAAEENRLGAQGVRALYFKGRALESQLRFTDAAQAYKIARSRAPGYYQILAAGRYEFLNDEGRPKPLAQKMVPLLEGPRDQDTLGFYLWLSDRLPWPWPSLRPEISQRLASGEAARTKAVINHYLALGDLREALSELAGGYEALLPKKPEELNEDLARWIILAAQGGDYRLALRFLSQVKSSSPGASFRAWAHPVVYGQPILRAYRLYGLPPELTLSVIRVESAFQADAVSASNARGLAQLLPSTAKAIATALGEPEPREEDLFDPALNIRYGTWYLNELKRAFGHWPLAVAAYNGGPFNIKSYLEARQGTPLDIFIETLPLPETVRYVQSVLESQFVYEAAYLGVANYPDLTIPLGPLAQEPPPF
ncbi:MAG: lytic transglycosylase domain-containing protein [Deltaproteobacteria bacterium]|nr:lytic transglycosylase domain-containing protein [Deltaproteobacteria bacterium]